MGKTTHWTYDAGGRVLSETAPDPDGAGPLPAPVTSFTYDLRGLRSTVTDANGNTTGYVYDPAGRVVEEIDPRGNHTYFEYNATGEVTRVVDRNSRKKEFSYNDLGLVTQEIWVDGFGNTVKTIVHGYDDTGRETSVSDGVTAYQYQYDLADRVTRIDNAGSLAPQVTLTSDYDFEGNRTVLQDSLGGSVSYTWLNQRLQSIVMTTEAGKYAGVDFTYDPVGRLESLRRTANGDASTTITTAFTRDLLDRITGITHSKVSGGEEVATILSQFGYSYDANSRVVGSTGPEGSLSFALDTTGQLLSVTGSRSENYAYDLVGNRSAYITDEGNLIVSDGQFTYSHDLEGNLKTKTRISDGQVTEYFWDHRNQLTKAFVKNANGVILKELRFTYDVEGRRVGEWVDADGSGPGNPDQVWTVFDGANPYMDLDTQGNVQERYLYGPGIDEIFARIGAGEDPEWYLPDRLGSVRQIVDAAGTILDAIVYNSFGGILSESNPSQGDRFKFTGREYCPELGIYYYRARWYDPATGRFISPDPIGFKGRDPNLYRYVGNGPGDATDPWGLYEGDIHFYMTYYLAIAAGIPSKDAYDIAWANGFTDYHRETEPVQPDSKWWRLDLFSVNAVKVRRKFHFRCLPGDTVEGGSKISAQIANDAINSMGGNTILFGIGLHAFEDSWSHAGIKADGKHSLGPDNPDFPYNGPKIAMDMANEVFNKLSEYRQKHYPGSRPLRSFEEIRNALKRIMALKGSEKERTDAWKLLIKNEFNLNPVFNPLRDLGDKNLWDKFSDVAKTVQEVKK